MTNQSRFPKACGARIFVLCLRGQPHFLKSHNNSASEKVFSGLFRNCLVLLPPQEFLKKEMFEYTRIHSLLVNWCHHSVESRALTFRFKQSDLSAWSLLSWHPPHTHLLVRLSVFWKLFALHRHGHATRTWLWIQRHSAIDFAHVTVAGTGLTVCLRRVMMMIAFVITHGEIM